MTLIISVILALVLIFLLGYLAPALPFNNLLGGNFYQAVSIILAILISMILNLPMLYMMRGNNMYKKGEYKKAAEWYKKAWKTKRLSPDMEIYCGYMLLKEGDKKSCGEIFEHVEKKKLSERQKNSLDTNRALLLWKTGDIDGGIALLKSVWEREESVTVGGSLGALMLVDAQKKEDYLQALDFCRMTNEKYTYERTILSNLGQAYYLYGDNEKALKTFEELTDCGISAPGGYYYYALALIKDGRQEEAAELLKKALRMHFSSLSTVTKKAVREALETIES